MIPSKQSFTTASFAALLLFSISSLRAGPYVFWVNNDYDRVHSIDCPFACDTEQDDLGPIDVLKLPSYQQVPDCNYVNSSGQRVIPCTRDLEDFARLWMAGVTSNLVAALPTNSTLTLSWTDYEGQPTIDLFVAADTDGGIGYLTNSVIASNQIDIAQCPYIGRLGPGQQIQFTKNTWRNSQFIWCGVKYGGGALTLTIADGNGNTLAQTKSYIDLVDVKQMYERWTAGESAKFPVMPIPIPAPDGIGKGASPTQFGPPETPDTPYILLVHGWNMETWDKDRFAETAFKRLYWQGYQGRFGFFRWPTGNKFSGLIAAVTDARNYDNSESNAWASATSLLNLLTNLNAKYPGHVYLMAHSMGNVIAGEALRLSGNNHLVNTYVAMQAAIPAHCYDPLTTTNSTRTPPDRYAYYYTDASPCYFNATAGAENYFNFYNQRDYALGWWNADQSFKPDNGITSYPGYHYSSSSGFYVIFGAGTNDIRYLAFPNNTYEIFAYGDPSWSFALGAQANVGGTFKPALAYNQVNLDAPPYSFGPAHKGHSAQFRSDNMSRTVFWHTLLDKMGLLP